MMYPVPVRGRTAAANRIALRYVAGDFHLVFMEDRLQNRRASTSEYGAIRAALRAGRIQLIDIYRVKFPQLCLRTRRL